MQERKEPPWCGGPRSPGRLQDRWRAGVERVQGRRAEGHDDLRPQEDELAVEIRSTRACRRSVEPIPGRPALEEIEHSDLRPPKTETLDGVIQPAPGPSHERDSRTVLEGARRLAHENHPRREAAAIHDRMRPSLAERTTLAGSDLGREPSPCDAVPRGEATRTRRPRTTRFPRGNRDHRSSRTSSDPIRSTTRHGP